MSESLVALATEGVLLGAASGLHCVAMCGPLAACVARPGAGRSELASAAVGYQGARALGYVSVGALCGAVGSSAIEALGQGLGAGVPWAMALLLGLGAAGVLPRLGALPWLGPRIGRAARRADNWTPLARGLALGALTPLLPCGLLLAAYSLAVGSGSALSGAVALGSFALGSMPLLLAAQLGWGALRRGRLARFAVPAQRVMMLIAALTLAWRGWLVASGASHCAAH